MKHIVYNKLVRDRIPKIIVASGKRYDTRILSDEEYLAMLRIKLHEEIAEYEESGELEELADILEILHALAVAGGNTPEELEVVRARKANERGGFTERIFLISVDEAD
jgi:predicted house-cleaning noncanonical NTP pyrophosphatase (MazG superfamily)